VDLREYLASEGLTLDEAALVSKMHVSSLSRICSGQQKPRPLTVVKLARGLGVNPRRMERMVQASMAKRHHGDDSSPGVPPAASEAA